MPLSWKSVSLGLFLAGVLSPLQAAQRATVHTAAYSEGFLVETQRDVTVSPTARRSSIRTQASGIASGEAPETGITIERIKDGRQIALNPKTKTYTDVPFMDSGLRHTDQSDQNTQFPGALKITRLDAKTEGPFGSDTINGIACKSYTVRVIVEFTDSKTNTLAGTESLLEKLWMSDKAPQIEAFRAVDETFDEALYAKYGAEKINARWLLREFNRQLLDMEGDPKDFVRIRDAYRQARAQIKGVAVRQLAAWTWQPKGASGPAATSDMPGFIASLASGLGAPPDTEGKTPLPAAQRPKWVTDMGSDFGVGGKSAMLLTEVLSASTVNAPESTFTVPESYKKAL